MRRRLLALLTTGVLASGGPVAAQTQVTLREGTDVRLSASADGARLSFDLAGLIWTVNPADGTAQSLTAPVQLARRPALSPDGGRIVFDAGAPGRRQLWLIEADGSNPQRLTFGNFDHHNAVWHPTGERVAFVSNRSGSADIWELVIADLSVRQRSFTAGAERDPAYSSGGEQLAYVTSESDGDALYTLTDNGRSTLVVRSDDRMHAPSWRPDGSLITFVYRRPGRSELRMAILSDPPVVRPLTRNENLLTSPALWLDAGQFIYMADGRIRRRRFDDFEGVDIPFQARLELPPSQAPPAPLSLAVAGASPARGITGIARLQGRLFVTALGDLWELDGSGTVVQKLSTAPHLDTQLVGAPAGSRLAFVSDRGDGLQVWMLDLVSGEQRALTAEPGGAFYPAWSPDGEAIAYLAEAQPAARRLALKQVDLASGEVVELARGLPDTARPRWLGTDRVAVQLDAGGGLAFGTDGDAETTTAALLSPTGRHVASFESGALSVRATATDEDPAAARVLAATGAARVQWIDGGETLAWIGPDGIMTWSAATDEISALPVNLSWQAARPPRDGALVIRAGRVFDGLGPGYEYAQDILIVGNRIAAIGPWRDPPPGKLLDARDLTVLPGLMDLAVQTRRPGGERAGRAWLAWGVTSVREFVRDPIESTERRESWASGQRPGPRLFPVVAGCAGSDPLAEARRLGAVGIAVCDQQDGEALAAAFATAGADGFVTIAADPFPGALLGAREIPVRGRPGATAGYPDAANRFVYGDVIEVAGAGELFSVSGLSPIGLPGLLLGEAGITSDPRLTALLRPSQLGWYRQSWQAQAEAWTTALRAEARTAGQSLFRAVGRGARIVTGSGAPAVPRGAGLHAELRLLGQTGLQPFQVLRMATLDAAAAIGAGGDLGSVRPGRLADLVLVRGDPLKAIEAAANVEMVLVDGRVIPARTLLPE